MSSFSDAAESILLHPIRRKIFSMVVQTPGTNFSKITRLLESSPSSIQWHLKRLEKAGYIRSMKFGGKRIYYPASLRTELAEEIILTLSNPTARKILLFIINHPPEECYQLNIARNLTPPLHHETVRYHLDRLKKVGLVELVKDGKNVIARPGPEASRLKEHGTVSLREEFVDHLLSNLRRDCLYPEILEQSADRLIIRIDCPDGEEVILNLELSNWEFQSFFDNSIPPPSKESHLKEKSVSA